ncbi:MAG: tetratricopeptide repeat protein [Planctomycetota bacterium]
MTTSITPATVKSAREHGYISNLRGSHSAALIGAIKVSGADAVSFLNSQLTNDVKALQPGGGNMSARVTRTGTLVNYFSVHRLPGEPVTFLLLLDGLAEQGLASLLSDLGKFAVVEDVVLEDVSEQYDWLAIQGPNAAQACEAVFGPVADGAWRDVSEFGVRDLERGPPVGSFVIVRSLSGDPGYIIAVPHEAETMDEIQERFSSSELGQSFVRLDTFTDGDQVIDALRIEAGVVRVGIDADEGKLVLPETGMEQHVVSYSKGCYLGQEVIARIRTYGSVPFVLRGLVFQNSSDVLAKLPGMNAELVLENGTKIGRIASRTFSPVFDAPIAFAYLDRAHRTPGTKLKIRANDESLLDAEVRLLPFYRAADTASRVAFLHDRAIRLFAAGDDTKAQELLEEALRLDPSFADGYEALGVLLGRTGKFTEAIDIFKRLEEVAPNEPMVHTNLSLFYMKLGDKVAAEDEKAKGIIKQFGRFAGAKKAEQVAAEETAKKRADAERKRAMFEEVLEIDADDPMALFGLGNALSTLGDWEGAERVLSKSCAVQTDNSAAYLARGKALEMLGREADAVNVYRAGMAVASKKGDLMPLREMERRVLLLGS